MDENITMAHHFAFFERALVDDEECASTFERTALRDCTDSGSHPGFRDDIPNPRQGFKLLGISRSSLVGSV